LFHVAGDIIALPRQPETNTLTCKQTLNLHNRPLTRQTTDPFDRLDSPRSSTGQVGEEGRGEDPPLGEGNWRRD
jgi:hypothetical protein